MSKSYDELHDSLSGPQLAVLIDARLYETVYGGEWYEYGQSGRSIPTLARLGLVEQRPASGVPGNYTAPAVRLTKEGRQDADDMLEDEDLKSKALELMSRREPYIRRNLINEGRTPKGQS